MCEEVRMMIGNLDTEDLMTKLALQCSPVIAGVKMSNLVIVKSEMIFQVRKLFKDTGLKLFVFCNWKGNAYALLYRQKEVESWIFDSNVRQLLSEYGYLDCELKDVLEGIRMKYLLFCEGHIEFPHELGLLLGFPPEDVCGFIENNGRNFLLCGYWKVYGDIERARMLFESFDMAKENAIRLIARKRSLLDLLDTGSDIKSKQGEVQYAR